MTKQTILIVDDGPENLTVLGEFLRDRYRVRAAHSGERALQLAQLEPQPDLILLDVMMPGLSGYDVIRGLRASAATRDIPVIFTTAMNATEDEEEGLALGAVDYLTKPLRPAIVLARVQTHLALKRARDLLRSANIELEGQLVAQQRENQMIRDLSLRALARLAETRDNETGNHILRTQEYVRVLACSLRRHPRFAAQLDDASIHLMALSAPLHDIGKVGIPDRVLLKPGKLTADEWVIMKTHARLGADAISRAEDGSQVPLAFLAYAKQVALHHHERWDGKGYPDGLAGEAIPLPARLMAVADVFDALISRRVYKAPMPWSDALALMVEQRGRHFDPDILDAFVAGFEGFCAIARQHPDEAGATAEAM